MALEIRDPGEFYDGPKGQTVGRLISQRLRLVWPDLRGRRVLGVGFAAPYLRPFVGEAERALAAVTSDDCAPWPMGAKNLAALVAEQSLPFPDASFDCLLVVHALEVADAQRPFLRELWRVLTSDGRLMMVVPNRTSLWAQLETSPFGHGRPYSRGQLGQLLEECLFRPEHWDRALFMPPFGRPHVRSGAAWDNVGRALWPRFAGVHIVEATKSLYAPVPKNARSRRLKPAVAGI